jgi:hypothetical protein
MSFRHASPIETFGNDKSALAETMIKADFFLQKNVGKKGGQRKKALGR